MAQITAALVKELRERTGAGMMDCKKALTAVEGDMDKAIDFLREKGLAAARSLLAGDTRLQEHWRGCPAGNARVGTSTFSSTLHCGRR